MQFRHVPAIKRVCLANLPAKVTIHRWLKCTIKLTNNRFVSLSRILSAKSNLFRRQYTQLWKVYKNWIWSGTICLKGSINYSSRYERIAGGMPNRTILGSVATTTSATADEHASVRQCPATQPIPRRASDIAFLLYDGFNGLRTSRIKCFFIQWDNAKILEVDLERFCSW